MAVLTPVLLILTLLHCTESEFVTEGGTVTLSCNKVREGQRKCDGTTWTFRSAKDPRTTKEVIKLGKISSRVTEMSNRLKVTENCGLQIQNVLPQDAGVFYCLHYNQSGRLLSTDPAVYLSVVSLTKEEDKEKKNVHLRCNTFSSRPDVKVNWRINDKDVNNQQINTNYFRKNINVTVLYSEFYSDTNLFKCEVSDGEKKKEFSFSSNRPGLWVRRVVFSVLTAALFLCVTVVQLWRRTQGRKAQRNRTSVHSVYYENPGEASVTLRV